MINISGSHTFDVPRERVWPRIFDPISLMGLIPGCEEIIQTAPGEYQGKMHLGVAGIRGTYHSLVKIVEEALPERCCFEGELSGPTGVVQGQARFTLIDCGATSQIHYKASGMVSGALATINPRFIDRTAESLVRIGLGCLNRQLKAQTFQVNEEPA